jgi:hypothetical protein
VRLPGVIAAAGVVLAASLLMPAPARADGLTTSETQRLMRGAPVVRPTEVERGGRRYVGGVSYAVVDAGPGTVERLIADVGTWQRILPRARSARIVGYAGADPLVRVTHGVGILEASYTIRVHRDGTGVRFWVDPSRTHDIEDAWGFLRVEPVRGSGGEQTVVSYGILVDMGPGLLRDLFEQRVRDLALSVPARVQGLVLAEAAAEHRTSR